MRGAATTAEASVVLSEEVGAPAVDHDHTQLVRPLPLDVESTPKRGSGRRWLYAGAALVLFGAATLAVTVATSSELPKPAATRQTAVVVPAPPPTPAPVAPVVAPAPPSAEVVAASAAPAPPPTEVKAAAVPVASSPPPEVAAAAPADREAPSAAVAEPVAAPKPASVERAPVRKPSARVVKKAAKPKYDPDALFFKGK